MRIKQDLHLHRQFCNLNISFCIFNVHKSGSTITATRKFTGTCVACAPNFNHWSKMGEQLEGSTPKRCHVLNNFHGIGDFLPFICNYKLSNPIINLNTFSFFSFYLIILLVSISHNFCLFYHIY